MSKRAHLVVGELALLEERDELVNLVSGELPAVPLFLYELDRSHACLCFVVESFGPWKGIK